MDGAKKVLPRSRSHVWVSEEELKKHGLQWNLLLKETDLDRLEQSIEEGDKTDGVIIRFHDWFCSTLHPDHPGDAALDKRFSNSPTFVQNENLAHPSAVDPPSF